MPNHQPPPTRAQTHARARALRKRMPPSQARLWTLLSNRKAGGHRFNREHALHPYILDFYCAELRIAVEVDGGAHENDERLAHDARRDAFLERAGIKVLRVPAIALLHQPDRVVAWIISRCDAVAADKAQPGPT